MRLRVVIPVVLMGALTLLAGLRLGLRGGGTKADPGSAAPALDPPRQVEATPLAPAPRPHALRVAETPATNSVAATHQAYVTERCAQLEDLAMEEHSASLAGILAELTNRDPDIRRAAIHAAVQFGSREAIPGLLQAAEQTDDPDEKIALLQAVKFLKLPTLSELAEQARTNAAATKP